MAASAPRGRVSIPFLFQRHQLCRVPGQVLLWTENYLSAKGNLGRRPTASSSQPVEVNMDPRPHSQLLLGARAQVPGLG